MTTTTKTITTLSFDNNNWNNSKGEGKRTSSFIIVSCDTTFYILAASFPYNLQNGPTKVFVTNNFPQWLASSFKRSNLLELLKMTSQCHPTPGQGMILKKKIVLSVFCCWSFADAIINSLWQGNTEGILRPSLVSICTHCNQFLCEPIPIICYEFKYMNRWFLQSTHVQASKCSQFVSEPLDQTFCAFWDQDLAKTELCTAQCAQCAGKPLYLIRWRNFPWSLPVIKRRSPCRCYKISLLLSASPALAATSFAG